MYDRLAQFYEWEHRSFLEDLPLYLGYARAAAGPILDGACGTGRITLPLAEAGYSITGVDSSAEMLSIARERAMKSPGRSRLRLQKADLRTMDLGEQYGLALVTLSSFQHLLTVEDQKQALLRLAAHLLPEGLLVMDLVNPSSEWMAGGDGALVHQQTAPYPEEDGPEQLSKFVARASYIDSQTDQLLLIYDLVRADGALRRTTIEMDMRFFFRFEIEFLLEATGFRLRDLFGDYELGSYHASSPRLIVVAEKR